MAAALLDAGCNNLARFVQDQQDLDISFQAAGNGFGGVELSGRIQFLQVFANGLIKSFWGVRLLWQARARLYGGDWLGWLGQLQRR